MRCAAGVAGGIVARLAKASGGGETRGVYYDFAMALGRRRFDGFQIAEKECFAYPSHDLEGLAHGAACPRNIRITIYPRKQTRELANR